MGGLIVDHGPVERDVLGVALHSSLWQVGGERFQVLLIGQHRHGLGRRMWYQRHSRPAHGQVLGERGGAEMLFLWRSRWPESGGTASMVDKAMGIHESGADHKSQKPNMLAV